MSLRDLFSPPLAQISGSAWASSRLAAMPLGPASVAASLASVVRREVDDFGEDDAPSARRGIDLADDTASTPPPPAVLLDHDASLLPANTPRLTSTRPQRTRRAIALARVLRRRGGGVLESGLKAIEKDRRERKMQNQKRVFFFSSFSHFCFFFSLCLSLLHKEKRARPFYSLLGCSD